MPVAIAKPLKIALPTGAEWSDETVIMSAAIAAHAARASWRWRTANARESAEVTVILRSGGFPEVGTDASSLRASQDAASVPPLGPTRGH
jgi:hypothetical protein